MPRCMHSKRHIKETTFPHLIKGFNSTHRRWEICDQGFVPTRKENGKATQRIDVTGEITYGNEKSPHAPDGIVVVTSEKVEAAPTPEAKRFLKRAEQRKRMQ